RERKGRRAGLARDPGPLRARQRDLEADGPLLVLRAPDLIGQLAGLGQVFEQRERLLDVGAVEAPARLLAVLAHAVRARVDADRAAADVLAHDPLGDERVGLAAGFELLDVDLFA